MEKMKKLSNTHNQIEHILPDPLEISLTISPQFRLIPYAPYIDLNIHLKRSATMKHQYLHPEQKQKCYRHSHRYRQDSKK